MFDLRKIKHSKKLTIYLASLAVAAVALILLTTLWTPFEVKDHNMYSSGIVMLWLRANAETVSVGVQNAVFAVMLAICAVTGYMLGSLNFAIMTSRELYHDDIRKYGSKNAGMTNMFRIYGKTGGFYTLAGDALKTAAAVFLGRFLGGENAAYLSALFCILGHIAPAKYRFKGGKGVVAAAIAILCLDPEAFLVAFAVFAIVFLIWRYVSLASVIGAFVYPAVVYYLAQVRGGTVQIIPLMFAIFVGILVVFMHRENLIRISERTENKVSFRFHKRGGDDDDKRT